MTQLFIEVPVTRRAAVSRIGTVHGSWHGGFYLERDPGHLGDVDGAQVVVRHSETSSFRIGFGRVVGRRLYLEGVASAAEHDIVYRVEDL